MRNCWRFVGCVFGVVLILLTTPSVSSAQVIYGNTSITVTASVKAHVYLIVDGSGTIKQIFSNADYESAPAALSGSINGTKVALSPKIEWQYQELKPQLSFKYGYIYQAPSLIQKSLNSAIIPSVLFRSVRLFGL